MKKIILVTAWNDSGAGHLCRYLDGTNYLNILPFEILLGNKRSTGITTYAGLVHGWYRWNLFREEASLEAITDFEEPELKLWLSGKKFQCLENYKIAAQERISSFNNFIEKSKINDATQITKEYIYMLDNLFYPNSSADILVHVPCAILDCNNDNFNKIFDKVIIVCSNPMFGYSNMKARNNITPSRFFERWYTINNISLKYLQSHKEKSLLVDNIQNKSRFIYNSKTIFQAFGYAHSIQIEKPTLLGQRLENPFYPFGGLLSLEQDITNKDVLRSLNSGDENSVELQSKCSLLYAVLQTHAK